MLFPSQHRVNDKTLRRYLLGALPPDETERLDDLSIANDDFAARLSAVENDLVDAYVQGELSGDTLERFRTSYQSSPLRREKVTFAQSLYSAAGGATPTGSEFVPAKPGSLWPAFAVFPRWAFAGALAILLAAGFLLVENLGLRNQLNQATADRQVLEQREHDLQATLDQQHASDAVTANELEQVRKSLAQLEQNSAARQPQSALSSFPVSVVAFVLSPQLRGGAKIAELSLPRGTTRVDLRLELEANDFPQYHGALKALKTGQIVWHSGELKAETKGQDSTVRISLPANLLKQEAYLLEITGSQPKGAAEFVSSYVFRIGSN
jgi:hypothetical protein